MDRLTEEEIRLRCAHEYTYGPSDDIILLRVLMAAYDKAEAENDKLKARLEEAVGQIQHSCRGMRYGMCVGRKNCQHCDEGRLLGILMGEKERDAFLSKMEDGDAGTGQG